MDQTTETAPDTEAPRSAGEMRLVREAILMVAGGGAPRVVVAGLRLADEIYVTCARVAMEHGVRLRLLRSEPSGRTDIAVERVVS